MPAAPASLFGIDKSRPIVRVRPVVGLSPELADEMPQKFTSFVFRDHHKKLDEISFTLIDDEDKYTNPINFALGAVIKVSFGYPSVSMFPERAFVIRRIRATLSQAKPPHGAKRRGYQVTFEGHARSVRLGLKPSGGIAWQGSIRDIVTQIAAKYGFRESETTLFLDNNVESYMFAAPGDEDFRIQRSNESDGAFLQRLARALQFEFYVQQDGLHFHAPAQDQPVSFELDLNDNTAGVMAVDIEGDIRVPIPRSMTAYAIHPTTRQVVFAKLESGETAGLISTAVPASGSPSAAQELITVDEVRALPYSQLFRAAAKFHERVKKAWKLTLRMVGEPRLHAKKTIALVNFSTLIDGAWYIEEIEHTVDNNGYLTMAKLRRARKAGKVMTSIGYAAPSSGAGAVPIEFTLP